MVCEETCLSDSTVAYVPLAKPFRDYGGVVYARNYDGNTIGDQKAGQ